MDYEIGWYIPGKVIYTRIWGDFHGPVLRELTRATQAAFRQMPAHTLIHVLTDLTEMRMTPYTLQTLRDSFPGIHYPNLGWFVLATPNKRHQFLAIALMQILYPQLSSRAFTSFADARAFMDRIVAAEGDSNADRD